jgi:tryptophan-rich sensory protein
MTIPIVTAALITFLVLFVGGALTTVGPWYRNLPKPSWNPPDWAFGPAWTIILAAAAWAGVDAWTASPEAHARIIGLYAFNIVCHLAWTPLFFNLRRPDWALIEVAFLWASIFFLIIGLAPYSSLAPWLLAPYLAWVSFAAFLNLTIVRMNPGFTTATPAEMLADLRATPLGTKILRMRA